MSGRIAVVAVLALCAGLATQFFGVDLAYSQTQSVRVWPAAEDPGTNPDWEGWNAVPRSRIALTAQQVAAPVGGGSVARVVVQTVHHEGDLVMRMSWRDATEDLSTAGTELFTDGVAVQFPANASSSVPAICMGQADGAVNIWHWRADSQAGVSAEAPLGAGYVDRYDDTSEAYFPATASDNPFAAGPLVQSLLAGGFGTLTPADAQTVVGEGRYADGEWVVVMRRSFAAPTAEHPQFAFEQNIDVAFATWDGSEDERDGIKSVSQFVRLSIRESDVSLPAADGPVPVPPGSSTSALVEGIFFGVLLLMLVFAAGLIRQLVKSLRG